VTGPAAFGRSRVVVDVPATSANLGAGFDALAIALDLHDVVELDVVDGNEVDISIEGEGADSIARNRRNRFVAALEAGLASVDGETRAVGSRPGADRGSQSAIGVRVLMRNQIPVTRGLGSSAAATIAGLVAANELVGGRIDVARLLSIAVELEGHPDNAAAALLGGFVAVSLIDGRVETVRLDPPPVSAVLYVPELRLRTRDMRQALPRQVPREDAVHNLGRVALGVAGVATGRVDLLRALTADRLHEPYRARFFPALPRLVDAAKRAGALGACLSGSGSTVIAFIADPGPREEVARALEAAAAESNLPGRVVVTTPRATGATVVESR
jgi:homoserine kinase